MTWSSAVKIRATELRHKGQSLSVINRQLGVAKSTLHVWFKQIDPPSTLYFSDRNQWYRELQRLAVTAITKKRSDKIRSIINSIQEEYLGWSMSDDIRNAKALLSVLYWAEGQKLPEKTAPVKFANTDPRLVLLFVQLLEYCYQVKRDKLKILLYLHWYHKEKEVKQFWMNLLQVDEKQFRRVYRKKRSVTKRFRKNFMGICFVIYHSVDLRQRIVNTAYEVQKNISKRYNTLVLRP